MNTTQPAAKKLSKLVAKQLPPTRLTPRLRAAAVSNHLPDSKHFAAATGLVYGTDNRPGISRAGKSPDTFSYTGAAGKNFATPKRSAASDPL